MNIKNADLTLQWKNMCDFHAKGVKVDRPASIDTISLNCIKFKNKEYQMYNNSIKHNFQYNEKYGQQF